MCWGFLFIFYVRWFFWFGWKLVSDVVYDELNGDLCVVNGVYDDENEVYGVGM